MKKFNTGYVYIDETTDEIKKELPEHLQKKLNEVLTNTHSLGLYEGYSKGVKSVKKD